MVRRWPSTPDGRGGGDRGQPNPISPLAVGGQDLHLDAESAARGSAPWQSNGAKACDRASGGDAHVEAS